MRLLEVKNLIKNFPVKKGMLGRRVGAVKAVNDISLSVDEGEVLGLVGESGCGKSTTGRAIMQLDPPTSGKVFFEGEDLCQLSSRNLRMRRRHLQMIFQDPYESLNPRHSIEAILAESFKIHQPNLSASDRRTHCIKLLDRVGLQKSALDRYPFEFSGGQRQRVGIARAISQKPKLVICDEPVSALDVSVQSQVLNLLLELQKELQLSFLFIAHDLAVVRHMSDRVAVMYLGEVVEMTDSTEIYRNPLHPYTKALIAAIPNPWQDEKKKKNLVSVSGEIPSALNPPSGCHFRTRCPLADEKCARVKPKLQNFSKNENIEHFVSCHKIK